MCVAVNGEKEDFRKKNPEDSVLKEERSVSYLEAFQSFL